MKKSLDKIVYITFCLIFILWCNSCKYSQNENRVLDLIKGDSNSLKTTESLGKSDYFTYPDIIDSLQLHELYDSTKLYLYLVHCKKNPMIIDYNDGSKSPLDYKFCSLDLRFNSVEVYGDTLKFYFEFYVNDTLALNMYNFRGLELYTNGRMYYKSMNPIYVCPLTKDANYRYCIEPISQKVYDTTTMIPELKPLQTDVLAYINENKNILHPWFYNEAVKKGMIKK